MKKQTNILIVILAIIVIGILFLSIDAILKIKNTQTTGEVTDFETCIAAGNPAMESYPRQCRDPVSDRTFTEEIDDEWRLDGIVLMQHETEGYFACFGCSASSEGRALCKDPIMEMKAVIETEERHCNSDFEVVE